MAEVCRILEEYGKAIHFANRGIQLADKWKLPVDSLDLVFERGLAFMMRGYVVLPCQMSILLIIIHPLLSARESHHAKATDFGDAQKTFTLAAKILETVRKSFTAASIRPISSQSC
jgi:hypothetical protein